MSSDIDAAGQIGTVIKPLSGLQTTVGLFVGSTALLMLGLQPLILGRLYDEGRLNMSEIGSAATAELLAIGATVGVLAAILPPRRLRLVNTAGCLLLTLCDLASTQTHGTAFVVTRGLAGAAAGSLVWIATSIIARAPRPAKVAGVFLGIQTLAQAGLAALLPIAVIPRFGANGALACLAALAVLATAGSTVLPTCLRALPKEGGAGALPLLSYLGLASVFFTLAGCTGLWVFVEQLGTMAHVSPAIVGQAVAAALAAQVLGIVASTLLIGRVAPIPVLLACSVADLGLLAVLGGSPSGPPYLLGVIAFGFVWMFVWPLQTRCWSTWTHRGTPLCSFRLRSCSAVRPVPS